MSVQATQTRWPTRRLQPRASQLRLAVAGLACLVVGIGWIKAGQELSVSDAIEPHRHEGPLDIEVELFLLRFNFFSWLLLISLIAGLYLIPKRAFATALAVVCAGFAYSFVTHLASKAIAGLNHETSTTAYGLVAAAIYGFVVLPGCISSMAIGSGFTLILERSKV